MEGEERVMHARLHRTEEFDASMELGRYRVIDLDELLKNGDSDKNVNKAFRLSDTRTITELIVDNKRVNIEFIVRIEYEYIYSHHTHVMFFQDKKHITD